MEEWRFWQNNVWRINRSAERILNATTYCMFLVWQSRIADDLANINSCFLVLSMFSWDETCTTRKMQVAIIYLFMHYYTYICTYVYITEVSCLYVIYGCLWFIIGMPILIASIYIYIYIYIYLHSSAR